MKQDMYSSTELQFLWLFPPSGLEQPALKWRLQLDQIKRIDLFRHNNAGIAAGRLRAWVWEHECRGSFRLFQCRYLFTYLDI